MKNPLYLVPVLPQDKANHVVYGAVIALLATGGAVALQFVGVVVPAVYVGVAVAALAGAIKEGADWLSNRAARLAGAQPTHGVEFLDFFATACGGAIVSAAVFLGGL